MKTKSNNISVKLCACLFSVLTLFCVSTVQASKLVETGMCKPYDFDQAQKQKIVLSSVDFSALDTIFSYNVYDDGVVLWGDGSPGYMTYDSTIKAALITQKGVVTNLKGIMTLQGSIKDGDEFKDRVWTFDREIQQTIAFTKDGGILIYSGTLTRTVLSPLGSGVVTSLGRTKKLQVACIVNAAGPGTPFGEEFPLGRVTIPSGTKKMMVPVPAG